MLAHGRILVCDATAERLGVTAGQRLGGALALAPALQVLARDAGREAAALNEIACACGRFTPALVVRPPDLLLLDIAGCLRLFGGFSALRAAVAASVSEAGWSFHLAAGATPLGTAWLARAGRTAGDGGRDGGGEGDGNDFPAALDVLPCAVAGWPEPVLSRLAAYGVRTLGALRALPAAGLCERLGEARWRELAQAYGERPDPQAYFSFPEHFAGSLELPGRVEQAAALLFGAQRLLVSLVGWLRARRLRMRQCELWLAHERGEPTRITLLFGEPLAEEGPCLRLLREHLARLSLNSPVIGLRLALDTPEAAAGASGDVFARVAAGEGAAACLARLQARLGRAAVRRLRLTGDHRPECAAQECPAGETVEQGAGKAVGERRGGPVGNGGRETLAGARSGLPPGMAEGVPSGIASGIASGMPSGMPSGMTGRIPARASASAVPLMAGGHPASTPQEAPVLRPLWLLPVPQALAEEGGLPCWQGRLRFLGPPERLESGWWDAGEAGAAGDVRRDYFVAQNPRGQWAWVFRDAGGWFLHGLFA